MTHFKDRQDAGLQLAGALRRLRQQDDLLVVALPRGGVPVAAEVARSLQAPLDVLVVRKLGAPDQADLAIGAIARHDIVSLRQSVIDELGLSARDVKRIVSAEMQELERRRAAYGCQDRPLGAKGKSVVVVDDGLATGETMHVAVALLRQFEPKRITCAVPVAPVEACARLEAEVDRFVCLFEPEPFWGVGCWYQDFTQTSDEQVCRLLQEAGGSLLEAAPPAGQRPV